MAYLNVRIWWQGEGNDGTHIFDIGAWMDGDNIAVLDTEVMPDHTVHARTSIIQIIICQDNENSILALLALHEYCVTTEKL